MRILGSRLWFYGRRRRRHRHTTSLRVSFERREQRPEPHALNVAHSTLKNHIGIGDAYLGRCHQVVGEHRGLFEGFRQRTSFRFGNCIIDARVLSRPPYRCAIHADIDFRLTRKLASRRGDVRRIGCLIRT